MASFELWNNNTGLSVLICILLCNHMVSMASGVTEPASFYSTDDYVNTQMKGSSETSSSQNWSSNETNTKDVNIPMEQNENDTGLTNNTMTEKTDVSLGFQFLYGFICGAAAMIVINVLILGLRYCRKRSNTNDDEAFSRDKSSYPAPAHPDWQNSLRRGGSYRKHSEQAEEEIVDVQLKDGWI